MDDTLSACRVIKIGKNCKQLCISCRLIVCIRNVARVILLPNEYGWKYGTLERWNENPHISVGYSTHIKFYNNTIWKCEIRSICLNGGCEYSKYSAERIVDGGKGRFFSRVIRGLILMRNEFSLWVIATRMGRVNPIWLQERIIREISHVDKRPVFHNLDSTPKIYDLFHLFFLIVMHTWLLPKTAPVFDNVRLIFGNSLHFV